MIVSDAGIALIKSFESFRPSPYRDQAGIPTQGFGHTDGVTMDDPPVTEAEATDWLLDDLTPVEEGIARYVRRPLNQNQFDALASLCFNCGLAPVRGTLGTLLNGGDVIGAGQQFLKWVYYLSPATGRHEVSPGLVARREREKALFLTPVIIANNGVTA